ncbi:SEL1-like repeat protein, partial [Neisseria sp. P0015.S010]
AKQRDTMAQYNLACLYYHGMGVEKDINNACFWLQEAIQHGHEQQDVLKELLAQWKQFAQKASAA